ncbi:MAG: malectin domain-containing carbohydrate-binding protein [Gammaproteobacteria bacterium]|nr:hypothetical protein [Gammaproteobacteria bacterium]
MTSREAERQELERVIQLLGRHTRSGRLLEYVGTKYFQQQASQLTEFNIATEVFGRSPKSFDPTQDAVVRVEAHRLRKKLREIYEQNGDTHGVHITLPPGTYVPKFVPIPERDLGEGGGHGTLVTETSPASSSTYGTRKAVPRQALSWLLYLSSVVAVALLAVLAIAMRQPPPVAQPSGAILLSDARPFSVPLAPVSGQLTELHIMAGYSGSEIIDNSGVRWTPDRFFSGGGPWQREVGFVRGTSRPFLFENWRSGEFGYDIPVAPGSYELRLYFIAPHRPGDEKLASFDVFLNGQPLLTAFDVNTSAQGADVAEEQVFRDVVPDEDGYIRLRFTNQAGTPSLNALELVPGSPGKLKPIRITTQPTAFVDHKGQRWRADDYYFNGFRSAERRKVTGTDDPEIFGAERYGHFRYSIPVDVRGRYTVVLHFAEFYFGPQLPGGGGVGSRIFHVYCNGQTLLKDFDIYKEAGSLRLVTKTFHGIKPSAQGKINLTFEPVVNNATVSGIEILDESV